MAITDLSFIEQAEYIVFIGGPGTGKTGLAVRLLRQALIEGYRGRFYNAQDLLDELYASLADRSYGQADQTAMQLPHFAHRRIGTSRLNPNR
jgi:DNA replication protein DnaC